MGFFVSFRKKLGNLHFGIRLNGAWAWIGLIYAIFYYMFVGMAWLVYLMCLMFYCMFKWTWLLVKCSGIGLYYIYRWVFRLCIYMFRCVEKFFKWLALKIESILKQDF